MEPSSPRRKACCDDPANLTVIEQRPSGPVRDPAGTAIGATDITVRRCIVCGARHFELAVEPIQVSTTGCDI